jgi:murein DD-endopeptidase MepM/ murein hydrolase activator NlpD
MNLRRSCATIYLPAPRGGTRRVSVPAWAALATCVGTPAATALAVLLALGAGPAWLGGNAPLARENAALRATMVGLDLEVEALAAEVLDLAAIHDRVAGELDLPQYADGGFVEDDPRRLAALARSQRLDFEAMLDTLASREEALARIPSIAPCNAGWTSSLYGPRRDPFTGRRAFHRGVDFSLPSGTPVLATAAGTVAVVERQAGLGLLVKVDHGHGLQTVYAHLGRTLVRPGDAVGMGTVIARSGNSGRSTAPHLHYEVRVDGRAVNPRSYLAEITVAGR